MERRKVVWHINAIKRFIERDARVSEVLIAQEDDEEDAQYPTCLELEEGAIRFNIGDQLDGMQKRKLLEVLESFPDVFSDVPERTDLVQCQIKLKDPTPCKIAAYKIPDSLKQEVEDQITKMLQLGLIEESDSEYSSPLAVVKKTDGSIRLCVNYSAL